MIKFPHLIHKYKPTGNAFIAYYFPYFFSDNGLRTVGICRSLKCEKCGKEKKQTFEMKFNDNLSNEQIQFHNDGIEENLKQQQ